MRYVFILFIFSIICASHVHAQLFADRVLMNSKIYTSNDLQPFAEAIAIKADTIIYVGLDAGVTAFIDANTIVMDLNGKLILPGIHDVHTHIMEASSDAWGTCALSPFEFDPENHATTLLNCNLQPNSNGWLIAYGHSIFTLFDAVRPPKEILDDIFPNTPIICIEETSHSVWVNSEALAVAGISASTPDPDGGHIVMELGQPNGILLDNAGDAVLSLALASNTILDQNNYDGLINFGLPLLRSNGITSVCEGRTYWKRNFIQTWQDAYANGELTARTVLAPWAYPDDPDSTLIPDITALFDPGDEMLRISQVKVYSDGITINATAALHDPYNDDLGMPFNTGLNYFDSTRLEGLITSLETVGYDFHIHAIGDRGVTESLNAIEGAQITNGNIGARHRVTHLEIVDPMDYPRFAALDVTADMQVVGPWTLPAQWQENAFLIGPVRADNMIPLRSIFDSGARITLSSDYDVSAINPFLGIENALKRSPQELPTVEDAVKAYTINGAYTMRQEDVTGSLEVGKYADLICVDRDIFTIPIPQISNTTVELTMLGGEIVFSSISVNINEEGSINNFVSVAPTLSDGHFQLLFNDLPADLYKISILDLGGKVVRNIPSYAHSGNSSNRDIDISDLSEGMYLISFSSENGALNRKLKVVISR